MRWRQNGFALGAYKSLAYTRVTRQLELNRYRVGPFFVPEWLEKAIYSRNSKALNELIGAQLRKLHGLCNFRNWAPKASMVISLPVWVGRLGTRLHNARTQTPPSARERAGTKRRFDRVRSEEVGHDHVRWQLLRHFITRVMYGESGFV